MMRARRHTIRYPSARERGFVLILSMILLLAMTMIGVSSMGTTSLEETMTKNERNRHTAFQAAEAALREGERYVVSQATSATVFVSSFVDACTNGLCTRRENDASYDPTKSPCDASSGIPERWDMWSCGSTFSRYKNVWNSSSTYRSHSNTSLISTQGIAVAPKYIIEFMGYMNDGTCTAGSTSPYPCDELYRVTAFATGGTSEARVMLQSVYQIGFD